VLSVWCGVQLMWVGFGVVWDLRLLGLIDTRTEEVAYLCCDFTAKVWHRHCHLATVGMCTCHVQSCAVEPQLPCAWLC
jgi:hypothetical protein